MAILRPVCKAVLKPVVSAEIYPMVRRAFALARSGAPGPVAVEISANLQMLTHDLPACVFDEEPPCAPQPDAPAVEEAVSLLEGARRPAIYAGYGARGAFELLKELAERLAAPVTTTIQGKGVFPETHPLWLWNGFGTSAPPFVRKIMDQCDCLLAIGCRFAEVATASYGMTPPENLIHVDIDGEVFNRNYRARLCVQSDARAFVAGVLESLQARPRDTGLEERIAQGHAKVLEIWRSRHNSEGKVSPSALFEALHEHAGPDAVYVTDSGKGTFLAMEQLRLDGPGRFIGPVDFSCMGYAVPAAIGAKLVDGTRDVIALAGDGALLMTGLELLTAATYRVAPVVCVLRDGELSQIAGYQRASVVRTTCTILPDYSVKAFAAVTGCRYIEITGEGVLDQAIGEAIEAGRHGEPVVVEVPIDYSQVTYYTQGAIANTFWRYPWRERLRLICRFLGRKVTG